VLWIRNDLVVSGSYHGSLNFEAVSSSGRLRKMSKILACWVQSPVCRYWFIWFLAVLFYSTFSDRLVCVTDCMWKKGDREWFPGSGSDLDIKFLICPDPQHCLDGYKLGRKVFQEKEDHLYLWILSLFDITPLLSCSIIPNELFFKCMVSSNGSRETPENSTV
jgi:hypothetical protein